MMFVILLLLGSAIVPIANALDNREVLEEYYVSADLALINSERLFNDFLNSGAFSVDNASGKVSINPDSILIYDIHGVPLYHQFSIKDESQEVGIIKAAASKVLGSTVCTIEETPSSLNYQTVIENAKTAFLNKNKDMGIISAMLVCYSYPEIGVLVHCYNVSSGSEEYSILNARDFSVVSTDFPDYRNDPIVWSIYDEIPQSEYPERVQQWNKENAYNSKNFGLSKGIIDYKKIWNHNNLVSQPNNWWCAVASGKMIAQWFNVAHDMNHIADEMEAWNDSIPPSPTGVKWSNQLHYYGYDSSPPDQLGRYLTNYYNNYMITWDTAYNHIQTYNDPLTSSILGHVRVCAGWAYNSDGSHYLYIFDPGPVNEGSIKWENWNSITHIGYILVD
ncbi:hypothetical protein RJ53_11115 [Methanocalculus chunghsingensis]|uniref:Peptidase C39-like domain-containing protein n=2 Tax=Methanocalculus chunghsingensis TaxID=156457 RepID=A0A8J7WC64_9EURY|nr:hypothetical protein [Methanocalculus chunghsingensis]